MHQLNLSMKHIVDSVYHTALQNFDISFEDDLSSKEIAADLWNIPQGPQTPLYFFGNLFIFEPCGMLIRGLLNVGIFFDFQVARLFFSWLSHLKDHPS